MNLRRFLFTLFALALAPLLFGPSLFAQSTAKTFTLNAANQCATIGVSGYSTVGIQVTGTFSATLQPEVSIAGQSPQNTQVTPSTSSTAQSTITTTGVYKGAVGGFDTFLLCVSSYVSGAAVVYLNPTQAVNASLFGAAAAGALPVTLGQQAIYASNPVYGLHNDGRFITDATFTSSHNTISCSTSDCNFTAADNGKICFGSNLNPGGGAFNLSSIIVLPQGTLTVTSAQAATCSGGNSSQTVTAAGVFVWGSDDTTPLSTAWAAAMAACTILQLPGVNAQGTGASVMLVQSQEFGVPSSSTKCSIGVGASGRGLGVKGGGIRATFVIPTPNFSAASCTAGKAGKSCFFGFTDGGEVADLTIFGAGNSNPGSGFTGLTGAEFTANNWSYVHNVQLTGWGANPTNGLFAGITDGGDYAVLDHFLLDGFGNIGIYVVAGLSQELTLIAPTVYDTGSYNLYVDSAGFTIGSPVTSIGGLYGDPGPGTASIYVTSGSLFNSYGDIIGDDYSPSSTAALLNVQSTGVANLYGSQFVNPLNSAHGLQTASGGTIQAQGINIVLSGTTTTGITNAGSFLDLGGNTVTATTKLTGAGNYYHAAGGPTSTFTSAGVVSIGTTFTTNNGCGETTGLAGGSTAGTITTAGSTGCTTVVTMGNSATAPNGWSCTAIDLTTAGDITNPHQTATSQTTATFATGTIVAGDEIQFSCIGY